MRNYSSLKNKVILITGGSAGIGKQLAISFALLGARVAVCSENRETLNTAEAEFGSKGLDIELHHCDVRDSAMVSKMAESVLKKNGSVDVLINNAGFTVYRAFEESSLDENLDIIDVNLNGAIRCTKAFLPAMIQNRNGHIVNVSSIGGELIITPNASYCGAKHAIVAWSKAIRYELARFNIMVTVACPDHVPTNFQRHESFRRRDQYRKKIGASLTTELVSSKIIQAVLDKKEMVYIPAWAGFAPWFVRSVPFIDSVIWRRIMLKRVRQLYHEIEKERLHKESTHN